MPTSSIDSHPYRWPYSGDLRPDNTALVVIDMQTDFCGVGGYVDTMGYDLALTRAPIEPIKRVLAGMHAGGFPREGWPDTLDLALADRVQVRRSLSEWYLGTCESRSPAFPDEPRAAADMGGDPHAAAFLSSEHPAQEAQDARVVCVVPDDGPRARRHRAAGQEDRSLPRHSLPRRLQQGR